MEIEGNFGQMSTEDVIQDAVEDDYYFESEKCGICMDTVIDRGVLDCCEDRFCFPCIDNWATITNLCPLCKNQFQLITCIPVYDTIGGFKAEEYSLSRNDDWCIEGKHNTLSFPSYYINEDAVVCLNGDLCKIRSGQITTEEALFLDTSIACDSCDLWYHAFCVGFDPEDTSNNLWLCPRCIEDAPNNASNISSIGISREHLIELESQNESSFSSKVLVSIADTGDTDVVVSMVEGKQLNEESDKCLGICKQDESKLSETKAFQFDLGSNKSESQVDGTCTDKTIISFNDNDHEFSTSFEKSEPSIIGHSNTTSLELLQSSVVLPCHSTTIGDKWNTVTVKDAPSSGTEIPGPSSPSLDVSDYIYNGRFASNSNNLPLLLSSPVREALDDTNGDLSGGDAHKQEDEVEPFLPVSVDELANDDNDNADETKHKGILIEDDIQRIMDTSRRQILHEGKTSSDGNYQIVNSKIQSLVSFKNSEEISGSSSDFKDDKGQDSTLDIMTIVRETEKNHLKRSVIPENTSITAGLRVRKIMRRSSDNEEASHLVLKIRNEIRDVVGGKTSVGSSKKDEIDSKLLIAFRNAIVGNKTESNKISPSILKLKKSILQKGKSRENLTKKIYGTTSGKRRRAWDRDWEIEFWKYRCLRTKNEKSETLKSVLELLKKNSDTCLESSQTQEFSGVESTPILSRLYLADTSVFPRKEDIKPLSVLTDSPVIDKPKDDNEKNLLDKIKKVTKAGDEKNAIQIKQISQSSSQSRLPSRTREIGETEENACKSNGTKIDKKKWALEVLARKTASINGMATRKSEEDNVLKKSYPLLAQLPSEMQPVLQPARHKKIPTATRQVQLYRLAEYCLKKANLPIICRTAETELAMADAMNIEKEICNRSSSKLVYVNLCSQTLSRWTNEEKTKTVETDAFDFTDPLSQFRIDPANESPSLPITSCGDINEALRLAGLLSDSPPNSPQLTKEKDSDTSSLVKVQSREQENIFDECSRPELDIYGDFDYDLGDENYICSDAVISKLQTKEDDPKMRIIFSGCKGICNDLEIQNNDAENFDMLENMEIPSKNERRMDIVKPVSPGGEDTKSSILKVENGSSCPLEPYREENIDPLLNDLEELYGPPKKETLLENIIQKESTRPNKLMDNEMVIDNTIHPCTEIDKSCKNSPVESKLAHDLNPYQEENSPAHSVIDENTPSVEHKSHRSKPSETTSSISRKVEAYIKEHIRPLCKSGVITLEQYRWAVGKTTEKVMKYHLKAKNANFLIKEGDKVKKLAEQYVEVSKKIKE